jgi:hypothetical protein
VAKPALVDTSRWYEVAVLTASQLRRGDMETFPEPSVGETRTAAAVVVKLDMADQPDIPVTFFDPTRQ